MTLIFVVWEKYENYSLMLAEASVKPGRSAQTTSSEIIKIHLVNLLNFIENLATIYNSRTGTRRFRDNAGEIVSVFLAQIFSNVEYAALLDEFTVSPRTFEQIRKFRRRHRSLIDEKSKRP